MPVRREETFESGGARCAADLYLPDHTGQPVPCVVMGHGGSGTKGLGLDRWAHAFTAAGIAALAFDYRGFGASDGRPRQVIDIDAQRDDYHAAIRHARRLPDIDARRVALWGTSLSGGHVLAVAADDPAIAAVVSQVPLIDGWHRGAVRERLRWDTAVRTARFTAAAVHDLIRDRLGQPPDLVPVVAEPGRLAVFTSPEARDAFQAMGGEDTGWRNALAPRVLFTLPRYHHGDAQHLTMPLLMCLADRDGEASPGYAAHIAAQAPDAEIHHYPIGHFDAYLPPHRDQLAALQADFLHTHLHATTSAGSAA